MKVQTLTAALLAAATTTLAAPLLAPRATCYSGFYMIVARGSNEDPGEGKPGQVADLIAQMVPDSGSVAVDYPATIISGDSEYPESVTDGINDTKAKIEAYIQDCGGRIVLIGYSQGGNVMTDVLAGGVDKPDPITAEQGQYIAGVVVFGDPSFTVGQSFDSGTATKSGIFSRGGDSLALLNQYASVLKSYCDVHDTFCATGDSLSVHEHEVENHENEAAQFIASLA